VRICFPAISLGWITSVCSIALRSCQADPRSGPAWMAFYGVCSYASSERSVAGGGAIDNADISCRHSGVMSILSESSEGFSCSTLRAPMIGAVIAECDFTQATASVAGCMPLSRA
jgi:hypothetical protein